MTRSGDQEAKYFTGPRRCIHYAIAPHAPLPPRAITVGICPLRRAMDGVSFNEGEASAGGVGVPHAALAGSQATLGRPDYHIHAHGQAGRKQPWPPKYFG